jgi:hypothetical protein
MNQREKSGRQWGGKRLRLQSFRVEIHECMWLDWDAIIERFYLSNTRVESRFCSKSMTGSQPSGLPTFCKE